MFFFVAGRLVWISFVFCFFVFFFKGAFTWDFFLFFFFVFFLVAGSSLLE